MERMQAKLILVFETSTPLLKWIEFLPAGAPRTLIRSEFSGVNSLHKNDSNQTISLAFCFVDYHLWSLTNPEGDYLFPRDSHPDIFKTLWNLLDSPGRFVVVFGTVAGEKLPPMAHNDKDQLRHAIFKSRRSGERSRVSISRQAMPPENILIMRGATQVHDDKLNEFRKAVAGRYDKNRSQPRESDRPSLYLSDINSPRLSSDLLDRPIHGSALWAAIGWAERLGTERELANVFEKAVIWLGDHPEDVFNRAIYLFVVLARGNPRQMVDVVKATTDWLEDASVCALDTLVIGGAEWQDRMIDHVWGLPYEHHGWMMRHVEEGLMRAAFLRWLKYVGKTSQLGRAAEGIRDLVKRRKGKTAVRIVHWLMGRLWLPSLVDDSVLRLCKIWLVARTRNTAKMAREIDRTLAWLDRHPDETLVRTTLIWLAGFQDLAAKTQTVLSQMEVWLADQKHRDECVPRAAFIWLVGEKGASLVESTILETTDWLNEHPADSFVRITFLLCLIRRQGNDQQVAKAMTETRAWLESHPDDDLVRFALKWLGRMRA